MSPQNSSLRVVPNDGGQKEEEEASRCDYAENLARFCPAEFIYSPRNEQTIGRDEPFKSLDIESGSAVQIKPQRVDFRLRPRL